MEEKEGSKGGVYIAGVVSAGDCVTRVTSTAGGARESALKNLASMKTFVPTKNSSGDSKAKISTPNLPASPPNLSGVPPDFCPDCLGESFWRPHHSDQWFCDECLSPSTAALVAERHPPEPAVEVSEVIVLAGAPACRNCGGAWYIERWEGVDGFGITTLKCWTCRHPVTGEIQVDLIREPKRGGLCQGSCQKRRKLPRTPRSETR